MTTPGFAELRFAELSHGSAEYWDTVALRDALLRRPLGLVFSPLELAAEATSHHLVAYLGERLCACLVLAPLPETPRGQSTLKMRQVAVAASEHRKGIGSALVTFSESFALRHGAERITLHARAGVVGFYERLGYSCTSGLFDEVGLPHRSMQKLLNQGA